MVELLQCDHWSQISLFYNPKICPNFQTEYSTRKLSIDIVMLICGKFELKTSCPIIDLSFDVSIYHNKIFVSVVKIICKSYSTTNRHIIEVEAQYEYFFPVSQKHNFSYCTRPQFIQCKFRVLFSHCAERHAR